MIILVCCVHNFMLQNYIASVISFVYKLQRCTLKLRKECNLLEMSVG